MDGVGVGGEGSPMEGLGYIFSVAKLLHLKVALPIYSYLLKRHHFVIRKT